jgi:hypothetical protein
MVPIDNALAAIKLLEPGDHFTYREIGRRFNVLHTTLSQRHQGRQRPQAAKNSDQLALNPQQEAELVRYIEDLTKRALPLTRAMIKRIALYFNPKGVSNTWVDRFIGWNSNHPICKWTSGVRG